jgi:uncharacterized protein YlxW (UPF0749 family)
MDNAVTYGDAFGESGTEWDTTALAGKRAHAQHAQHAKQMRTLARKLERLLAKRRKIRKMLRDLSDEIRDTRRFLNQI